MTNWTRSANRTLGPAVETTGSRPLETEEERRRLRIISVIFFCFLLFLVARPHSGPADDENTRIALAAAIAGGGDAVRQVAYTLFFFAAIALWILYKGFKMPRGYSLAHILLIAWVLLSVTWAEDPSVSIRRSIMLFFVMTFVLIPVDIIGSARTERILYLLVASCLVVSMVCLPFGFARHPASESDASLIGDWRGIFQHKNVAGAVVSMGVIVYVFRSIARPNLIDAGLILLSIVFLIGSHSKTPAGFLPVALSFGLIHRFMWKSSATRLIYAYGAATVVAAIVLVMTLKSYDIGRVFGNPDSFTGRAGIWQAVIAYWQHHVWLGAGYGSLFMTDIRPPIARYANSPYQEFMAHSHNGYLDLLGAIGVPGLTLAIVSAIVIPVYQVMTDKDPKHLNENAMLLSIIVMGALENMMESQLYSKDKEIWTFFFIAIIILQIRYRERYPAKSGAYVRTHRRIGVQPTGAAA